MNDLRLIDTEAEPYTVQPVAENSLALDTDGKALAAYWRRKYDALRDESTPALIRSLRSQLLSIQQITEEPDTEETLKRIRTHCFIGLTISR